MNFDKVFIDGNLKGLRYSDSLRFVSHNAAKHFAMGDGLIITPCVGSGAYRQENSIISILN